MIPYFFGKKVNQSRTYTEDGTRIPVTNIEAGPCVVVQIKTQEHDGYFAIVLGFGEKKAKRTTKPLRGIFKKAGLKKIPRFLREVKLDLQKYKIQVEKDYNTLKINSRLIKIGDLINFNDIFKVGDKIDVAGKTKGKGFAGVVKRHGFAGGPRTHGQSDRERAPGSIGQTTTPGRVYKGKKMAGRMGNTQVFVKNLKVVKIDPEKNTLTVKGLIPGGRNNFLTIYRR